MDVALLVTSILGSAGLFGLVQFLISRNDNRKDRGARIEAKLDAIEDKCHRNELATTRLQLIYLIESQPSNNDTIMKTAQRYFVELNGDGEAWAVFHAWAIHRHINTDWYKALIKREEKK